MKLMDPQIIPPQPQPQQLIISQPNPLFSLPLIIGGVVLLFIGLMGGFYLAKRQSVSSSIVNTVPTVLPSLTPTLAVPDETANWKTYSDTSISFKYPSNWTAQPLQLSGSGSSVEIKDPAGVYSFIFRTQGNYNQETGKPFKDICEFLKIPYQLKTVIVGGQEAVQGLPRAGSESDFAVFLFSKDSKFIYSIELDTPRDGSKIPEGQKYFDQILSTFKFKQSVESGTITGILCFPSDHVPSGTVTAKNIVTGEIFTTNYTWDGQSQDTPIYKLALKPGNYHVKFDTLPDPKGLTGQDTEYYTENATCINSPGGCTLHSYPILTVTVQANQTNTNINVCDYIPNPNPPNF